MILMPLYINPEAVIPAKTGIQPRNPGFPRIQYGAGSVKPEMTNKGMDFITPIPFHDVDVTML
jgi:hypothetical protein